MEFNHWWVSLKHIHSKKYRTLSFITIKFVFLFVAEDFLINRMTKVGLLFLKLYMIFQPDNNCLVI